MASVLREQIKTGEITARLPSIKTISQTFNVSHVTAEKAMQLFKDEGPEVTAAGKGAYVAK